MRDFTFFCVTLFVCSCSIDEEPKLGPDGSWWLGGDDGGVFVNIADDANPNDNIYRGTIYNDSDHSIWYQGAFELSGEIDFNPQDRKSYLFWDGQFLHLEGGSYLQAVDPVPEL